MDDGVRVTAQLAKAEDGVDIWAGSYDREIKSISATQSDVTTATAACGEQSFAGMAGVGDNTKPLSR